MKKIYNLILIILLVLILIGLNWQRIEEKFNKADYTGYVSNIFNKNYDSDFPNLIYLLKSDYFDCNICLNSFINSLKLADSYEINESKILIIIVKNPDGKII